jgi:hypothetical protein
MIGGANMVPNSITDLAILLGVYYHRIKTLSRKWLNMGEFVVLTPTPGGFY